MYIIYKQITDGFGFGFSLTAEFRHNKTYSGLTSMVTTIGD